jgi:3-dehydroquinate dehydratase/shikimate dehydrogenase
MNSTNNARICVPVCVGKASELHAAIVRAAPLADIIELRLDFLEETELESARHIIHAALDARTRPFIITMRPKEQGGRRLLPTDERFAFHVNKSWSHEGDNPRADFHDIELDLALHLTEGKRETLADSGDQTLIDWERVICSHHDFAGTPHDLEKIYESMASVPARILKLVVRANDITDCIPVLRLLERARREGREMIALAMGEAGTWTRILAPSRGAFLTYGALDDAQATAPGQLRAADLLNLYRINSINEQTQITGLVGSPIAHSLSPHMHNAAFDHCAINGVYIPFEVRDVETFVRRMAHPRTRELEWNLRGLSVTAPHKRAIMAHLDWIEESAREIGAVNTVVVEGDTLRGYNTDASAALMPVEGMLEMSGARVAVIGAGGAARALLWSLRQRGARTIIFARDVHRARTTAVDFDARIIPLDGARFEGFDLVVNATPLGTRGHLEGKTPATTQQLRGARIVYDLVYNPRETRLLREARAAGCETAGGLLMLVGQAAEQFKLWTGREAPFDVMRAGAEKQMSVIGDRS